MLKLFRYLLSFTIIVGFAIFWSVPTASGATNRGSAIGMTALQEAEVLPQDSSARQRSILMSVFFAPAFGASADDFFDVYQQELGGLGRTFESPFALGASSKIFADEWLRLGLSIETSILRFTDTFNQIVFEERSSGDSIIPVRVGTRTLSEDIQMRTIPVFLTAEIMPVKAQFKTYAGAGLGASFGWIFWNEGVGSTVDDDLRVGGTHIDQGYVAPAARLYVGTQLGFDEYSTGSALHSLFIEVRYTYIGAFLPMFDEIAEQFEDPSELFQDDFLINPGGISIAIGLSFEFKPQAKGKAK